MYDLNAMFSDTKTLAQNAVDAIDILLSPSLAKTNMGLVKTAAAIWGISYSRWPPLIGAPRIVTSSRPVLRMAQSMLLR